MTIANYELIILARESAGLTQKELATELEIEQSTISKIEHNLVPAPNNFIEKMSIVANLPIAFFYQDWNPIRVEGHYRKKLSIPVKAQKQCKAIMTMVEKHLSIILNAIEIPDLNMPSWDVAKDGSPSLCAQYVREFWKMPKGRVENITKLLEDNGIIVVDLNLWELDAFSTISKLGIPIIFANRSRPGDRDLFNKCHEVFHQIAHFGKTISKDRDIEKEANEFASEFLMPTKDVQHNLTGLTIQKLADLKRYWKISMAAIIFKAKRLGMINQDKYEYLWKQMSALGYRVKEPIETEKEESTLVKEAISLYINDFCYSKTQLSLIFNSNMSTIDDWYFNDRPRLRVIRRTA